MKKILSLIIVLSMALSVVAIMPVSAEDKVIFTDSFESGMTNWILNSSRCNESNSGISSDYASDGKSAAYVFDGDDKTYGLKSNPIPATAGTKYTVSGDIYNVEGIGAKIFLTYVDAGGTRLFSKSVSKSTTGKWESVSLTETAPENTDAIVLILTGAGATTGKTYIDNIKITEGAAGAVASTTPAAPVINSKAGDAVISDSFENGFSWKTYSLSTGEPFELSNAEASEGKTSVRIYDESETTASGIRSGELIPIKEFNKYQLKAKAKGDVTAKVYLRIYDKDKKQLTQKSATGKSDSWKEYFVDVETPYGAATAEIIITTEDNEIDLCESCGKWKPYVIEIKETNI